MSLKAQPLSHALFFSTERTRNHPQTLHFEDEIIPEWPNNRVSVVINAQVYFPDGRITLDKNNPKCRSLPSAEMRCTLNDGEAQ